VPTGRCRRAEGARVAAGETHPNHVRPGRSHRCRSLHRWDLTSPSHWHGCAGEARHGLPEPGIDKPDTWSYRLGGATDCTAGQRPMATWCSRRTRRYPQCGSCRASRSTSVRTERTVVSAWALSSGTGQRRASRSRCHRGRSPHVPAAVVCPAWAVGASVPTRPGMRDQSVRTGDPPGTELTLHHGDLVAQHESLSLGLRIAHRQQA
jgi:hypothetical protein